jgi:hypothetical protein
MIKMLYAFSSIPFMYMAHPSNSPSFCNNLTWKCQLHVDKHDRKKVKNVWSFNPTSPIRFFGMLLPTHSSTTTNLSPSEAMHRPLVLRRLCSIMIGCRTPDWNQLPSHLLGNRHKSVERSKHNHCHEKHGPRQSEGEVAPAPEHHAVKACRGHGGKHSISRQYMEIKF